MNSIKVYARFWIGDVPPEIRIKLTGEPFYDGRTPEKRIGKITAVEEQNKEWYATVELDDKEFINEMKEGKIKK